MLVHGLAWGSALLEADDPTTVGIALQRIADHFLRESSTDHKCQKNAGEQTMTEIHFVAPFYDYD